MRPKKRRKLNEEVGPKYNVVAWEHFGKTKKLKGGFGIDGEEVQGTMKMVGRKGQSKKNNRNNKVKFRKKGDLFFKNLQRDSL